LRQKLFLNLFLFLFITIFSANALKAIEITDDLGRTLTLNSKPSRVVSLSPAATEVILALGAEKALVGVSAQDGHFKGLIGLPAVGVPTAALADHVARLKPDLLIVESPLAEKFLSGGPSGHMSGAPSGAMSGPISGAKVLVLDGQGSLDQAEKRLLELGSLFGKTNQARAILAENQAYFETLALKTAKLKTPKKRVLRLLGRNGRLRTPGALSFQNEIIRRSGGQTLDLANTTGEVDIGVGELIAFNPEIVYACAKDKPALDALFSEKKLSQVLAVKNHQVRYYPCALTDRAAAHTGYFAAWLSSALYSNEYGDPANLARPNQVLGQKAVKINVPYVSGARVVSLRLNDYVQKTLLIDFKTPQTVISTSDGPREGIETVGNGSSPVMVWDINHQGGWEADMIERNNLLGLDPKTSCLLFTGADLDNLAVVTKSYKDMAVTVLATAGAESNAVRTSKDVGAYYEPGTINVIVLSSRAISPTGAARAMITITEAKTAAVWDLDVRSSQTPIINPATGTGTDSVIIVAGGQGPAIDYTGGHTKMGQLIGEAVYEAVLEALALGNGLAVPRNVFARLAERGLDPLTVYSSPAALPLTSQSDFPEKIVRTFLTPKYAGLVESALALDDALNMGHVTDSQSFEQMAQNAASELAGGSAKILNLTPDDLPPALKTALNAIGSGLLAQGPID
jgi:adenosylcobinamide amidohydrolase/ABC-type Fe3+-hydroxamate transport system substrate-binding protein